MNRRFFPVLATLIAMLALTSRLSGAMAQEASAIPAPHQPDPALCVNEPRSIDNLKALFIDATPVAMEEEITEVEVKIGNAASPSVAEAVVNDLEQTVACLNAGDFARFFARLTDNAILTAFPWIGSMLLGDEIPAELLAPAPVAEEYQQLVIAIGTIGLLDDSRATAIMTIHDPASDSPGPEVLYLVFVLDGATWLIDEVHELTPN